MGLPYKCLVPLDALHSIITLSDSTAPYSNHATSYTIGFVRKDKTYGQKHGVALHDTILMYHVTSYFLLYPLLYGIALSESLITFGEFLSDC